MVLVIDNYDSFTYNLVQYLGELGEDVRVFRNDRITLEEIAALKPDHIVISPGPGDPEDGGISNEVIRTFGPTTPVLGECLGHQCIGSVYGGVVSRAPRLMHGKTSPVYHNGHGLFNGIPSPFTATRYHSLVVDEDLPDSLTLTAWNAEGIVMGVGHRELPVHGVQFHPESVLTEVGLDLLATFLRLTGAESGAAAPEEAGRAE